MNARVALRRALALPFRLLPTSVRRRLAQLLITATAAGDARGALVGLLTIADDVDVSVNDAAMRYGGGIHVKHRLMRYHDFFVERIPPGASVIDIGCGYGTVAHSIATRTDASVVGIDLDPGNIAVARRRFAHPRLTFVEGDALSALPVQRFDTVVLSNVLEHIADRVGFLRAAQDRLGPRALLIRVPMFDRDWRVALRQELGMVYLSDATHFTEYTEESFRSEMATAGLRIAELRVNWGEIWADVRPGGERLK